jgi:hypothetical protein
MRPIDQEFWNNLWTSVHELSDTFPDGIVFIGGVAVFLHVSSVKLPQAFVEFSHDGDFYIDLGDFSELRAIDEVTSSNTNTACSSHTRTSSPLRKSSRTCAWHRWNICSS